MRPRSSSKSMPSYAFARLTRYASENLPRAPVRLALLTNISRKSVGRSEWYPDSFHRDFLIDTDPASNGAVAPLMALSTKEVEVRAITTVAGNVSVKQGTRNALYVAELCGSSVPVYRGAARPIWGGHGHAEWFHGKDGLGDHGYPAAPP